MVIGFILTYIKCDLTRLKIKDSKTPKERENLKRLTRSDISDVRKKVGNKVSRRSFT